MKIRNLRCQHGVWHAKLAIPADIRAAFGGKKYLSRSTRSRDEADAWAIACPWLKDWKSRIDAVRSGSPLAPSPDQFPDAVAAASRTSPLAQRFARLQAFEAAAHAHGMDPDAWLRALTDGTVPASISDAAAGLTQHRTPFLNRLDDWRNATSGSVVAKTPYGYELDLKKFVVGRELFIETFTTSDIQLYVDARETAGKSRKTINKELTAVSNYWSWIVGKDQRLKHRVEFADIVHRKEARRRMDPNDPHSVSVAINNGKGFVPAHVPSIWAECGPGALRDAAIIASFTGLRRSGIGSLTVFTVFLDVPCPYLTVDEKTGRRDVPIHPHLVPTMRRLLQGAKTHGGYLFKAGSNKIGARVDWLNNPMAEVMENLDYPPGYGFHAFRHTFCQLLRNADVAEHVTASIVGHRINGLTYRTYAPDFKIENKMKAVTEHITYPLPELE